jgi:hypothetical protein
MQRDTTASAAGAPNKSKYCNEFIAKLVSIFDDVEKKREEREESLAFYSSNKLSREA